MSITSKNFLREIVTPEDPNIDLVAVHGLNPTNTEFHAEATWTSGGTLWLKDLLPTQLPRARVLLFGYNSNVAFETSTAGVREQAENLLNRLKGKRRNAPDRPIIFICHSLGGIIVKRALVSAKLDETYISIRSATYGIAFFATPHQGGNLVKLGSVAAAIARTILRSPKNTFLEALKVDSLFADDLIKDFRHQLEDYHILSFIETLKHKELGLIVVDSKSATLGLSGTREKQIALEADHASICKFEEGSDNYEQVVENLVELAESAIEAYMNDQRLKSLAKPPQISESSAAGRISLPYTNNPAFIGREKILSQLKELFSTKVSGVQQRAVLYGWGGVGKTQIAISFAYWIQETYPERSVLWVHASNPDRIREAFRQICQECKIPGADDPTIDKLVLVRDWLKGKLSGEWLMIIDNADDAETFFGRGNDSGRHSGSGLQDTGTIRIADYIPDCSHGSILVTTRNKAAGLKLTRGRGLIQVLEMSEIESRKLICRGLDGHAPSIEEVDSLSTLLGRLPLALVQAISFIQETLITIGDYLERYKSDSKIAFDLLSQGFKAEGRDPEMLNPVAATWIISFNQIKRQNPRAAELLSLMTFFDRQGIPKSLFVEENETPLDLMKALGTLKAFSLITDSDLGNAFEVHRLVQLVTYNWLLKNGEANIMAGKAFDMMAAIFPEPHRERGKICGAYLPHALAVISHNEHSDGSTTRATLLHHIAKYLMDFGETTKAEGPGVRAIEMRKGALGDDHPDTINSMFQMVLLFTEFGRWHEAEELQARVVEVRRRMLGDEHRETLLSFSCYMVLLYSLERFEEALKIAALTRAKIKRALGHKHPLMIASTRNHGLILFKQGRHKEAEVLLPELVTEVKGSLSYEIQLHPQIMLCEVLRACKWRDHAQQDTARAVVAILNVTLDLLDFDPATNDSYREGIIRYFKGASGYKTN